MGMTLVLIGIIGIVVGLIWILILNLKKEELGEEEFNKKATIPVIIEVVSFIVVMIFVFSDGSSSSSDDTSNWSEEASIECQNRSDTYHKCKWSVIEDRCVCKER